MWAVLGGIFSGVAAVVTAFVGAAAIKAKRKADLGAQDIEAVKISITSLQAALARSDTDRAELRSDLSAEREAHALTRAEVVALRTEMVALTVQFGAEKRACADRVKVLARRIRQLGGDPAEDGEHDD